MGMQKFKAPLLPLPRAEYEQSTAIQLVRILSLYFNQLDSTTPLVTDSISLLNLATLAYNQPTGTVYRDGDILKIALPNVPYVGTQSLAINIGTVTVTT